MAPVVKNLPANGGDVWNAGSIPRSGRSPGVGNGNPLQYCCLENSTDRGAWWATVLEFTKSQTWWSTLVSLPDAELWIGDVSRRGDPFQGLKDSSCLTLRNELSEEMRRCTCWQSKRLYWKETPRQKAGGQGNLGELLCHMAHNLKFCGDGSLRFCGDGFASGSSLTDYSDSGSRWRMHCSAKMDANGILEGGRTCGISFWPFSNSFGWWWWVSSVFLTGTSCQKITHMSDYYGAWPEWAISVSAFPLTKRQSCA